MEHLLYTRPAFSDYLPWAWTSGFKDGRHSKGWVIRTVVTKGDHDDTDPQGPRERLRGHLEGLSKGKCPKEGGQATA